MVSTKVLGKIHPEALASLDDGTWVPVPRDPGPSSFTTQLQEQEPPFIHAIVGTPAIAQDGDLALSESLDKLSLDSRFFGKSSSAMLVETVIDRKNQFMGAERMLPAAGFQPTRPVSISTPGSASKI